MIKLHNVDLDNASSINHGIIKIFYYIDHKDFMEFEPRTISRSTSSRSISRSTDIANFEEYYGLILALISANGSLEDTLKELHSKISYKNKAIVDNGALDTVLRNMDSIEKINDPRLNIYKKTIKKIRKDKKAKLQTELWVPVYKDYHLSSSSSSAPRYKLKILSQSFFDNEISSVSTKALEIGYLDNIAGIDISKSKLFINKEEKNATITSSKLFYQQNWLDGDYNVEFQLYDKYGSFITKNINFTIDTTPPTLMSNYPDNNSSVGLHSLPYIDLRYRFFDKNKISDIRVYDKNNKNISHLFTIEDDVISRQIKPSYNEKYYYKFSVLDKAKNEFNIDLSFLADISTPITRASIPSGKYSSSIKLNLISNEDATIYYTIDGSVPSKDTNTTLYGLSPILDINISKNTIIQFFSMDAAGNKEDINKAIYIFKDLENVNANISISLDENKVSLTWDDLGFTSYNIYRVNNIFGKEILLSSKQRNLNPPKNYLISNSYINNYQDTSQIGSTYWYGISGINANGVETLISDLKKVQVISSTKSADTNAPIQRAKNWIYSSQNIDGSWSDTFSLYKANNILSSTTVLDALHPFKDENPNIILKGLEYLYSQTSDNNNRLARKINTFSKYNQFTDSLISKLVSSSHTREGKILGWGILKYYAIASEETILGIKAIKNSRYIFENRWIFEPSGAIKNPDDKLHINNSNNLFVAAMTYDVFDLNISQFPSLGLNQHKDGYFEQSNSLHGHFVDTLGMLIYVDLSQDSFNKAKNYILARQKSNGSWFDDTYITALAIQALSKSSE